MTEIPTSSRAARSSRAEKRTTQSPERTEQNFPDYPSGEEDEREDTPVSEQEDPSEPPEEEDEEEGETKRDEFSGPPLPDEEPPPPLPNEAPPGQEDDGWEPVWDPTVQTYYFYNRFTGISQWENPRVPNADSAPGTTTTDVEAGEAKRKSPAVGGYNPAIHGDYDPTAPYAQHYEQSEDAVSVPTAPGTDPSGTGSYEAAGAFNRFTGKWQATSLTPENFNDENKSRRQMSAFFDVDAAANSHDGRSLRAERSAKKLSRKELKVFKDKRREKKEEKRRAWLRD